VSAQGAGSPEDFPFSCEIRVEGSCPEPVLKTARALRLMESGEVLLVVCLDPVSEKDLKAFCAQTGNRLLSQKRRTEGGSELFLHWIERR